MSAIGQWVCWGGLALALVTCGVIAYSVCWMSGECARAEERYEDHES